MKSCVLAIHQLTLILKVKLSENAAQREARLSEAEAELARTKDSCTHLSQVSSMLIISS